MGIYIFMDVLPNEIKQEDWEAVYEESLELIRAYPFLSREVDRHTYQENWAYALHTKEKELNQYQKGWHLIGDYPTMQGAESFILYRNIENYRYSHPMKKACPDILAKLINREVFYQENERQIPVDSVNVFDGKTQGYPHHNNLLAIACLFECRFPEHVVVRGDITIGQMNKAVKWANTVLKQPIQITERADNEKLVKRINRIVEDEQSTLQAFMSLNLQAEDFRLGEMIRRQFNDEVITSYFTERFKQLDVNTMGFRSSLSHFLNLGFPIEQACEICVLDEKGCQYDAKDFAETVLSLEWNDGKDRLDDEMIAYNQPGKESPETVYSQFGKMMMQMTGVTERMKSNLSSEEVTVILDHKLGEQVDVKAISNAEQNKSTDTAGNALLELLSDNLVEIEEELEDRFDISDIDYLILWKEGDRLHPKIEKRLNNLKDFIMEMQKNEKETFDRFNGSSDQDKINCLIQSNRYFLIRKECWDYYIENINQTHLMNVVFSILAIKADEIKVNSLCKAILNNRGLLEKYF
ncbi:hypothetical protein [Gracilibacillus timonensis]|uniref:hypothetical protein n=1 Tax=Gracilibacillus timonensis TaxID=1816696 RepID=UPI000824C85C|nr:hypothetical protein [Gracilibacillus timonensis]